MPKEIEVNANIKLYLDAIGTTGPVDVGNLPQPLSVIDHSTPDIDCEEFALGTKGLKKVLTGLYPEVDNPQPGDIVAYYSEDKGVEHLGILQEDGYVLSKWGQGPVIRHPIDSVPTAYGNWVYFLRIPPSDLERLRKANSVGDLIG